MILIIIFFLRYFTLQPDYIHERLQLLGKGHRLRILLVQVDVKVREELLKMFFF